MAIQPIRQERHRAIGPDMLMFGHGPIPYRMVVASVSSQMPITSSTAPIATVRPNRSEEHTSELQSLMRISYAVFCLQKKSTKISKERNVYYTQKRKHNSQV